MEHAPISRVEKAQFNTREGAIPMFFFIRTDFAKMDGDSDFVFFF
mgnify:CR=1 FL=1